MRIVQPEELVHVEWSRQRRCLGVVLSAQVKLPYLKVGGNEKNVVS